MDIKAVRNEMQAAAKSAADEALRQCKGDHGACGFAWTLLRPRHKGNTKAGKAERQVFAALGFQKDWTGKAYDLWNPSGYGGQSVYIKEVAAAAAARVLQSHGFDAAFNSRLD